MRSSQQAISAAAAAALWNGLLLGGAARGALAAREGGMVVGGDGVAAEGTFAAAMERSGKQQLEDGFGGKEKDLDFSNGLVSSFAMIMVCELGDETFIIAAIMAMRHPRALVLGGALGALYVMTVLSTALGTVAPYLISRTMVNRVAAMLYTFFGLRLMYIAYRSDPNETPAAEMEEVEEKLKEGPAAKAKGGMRKLLAAALSPVFVETFVLTFLAEWGDRSQIATIALGAHRNPYAVCVGAIVGHTICTGLAVWGGRLLALKFSQRMVAFTGGLLFLAFALHAAIYGVAGG